MFVNNGRTGTSRPHYAGGTGAQGNQNLGEINELEPTYNGRDGAAAGKGKRKPAKSWVEAGTWRAIVTRSYTGVAAGDNGDWFLTEAAAARSNGHEEDHIAATGGCHDMHINPLEERTLRHETEAKARVGGANRAEAIARLITFVDWDATIQRFKDCDDAANKKNGTVDLGYIPSVDRGPGTAPDGKNYLHIVDAP